MEGNFQCKTCGAWLDALVEKAQNGLVECPYCHNVYKIPSEKPAPAPAKKREPTDPEDFSISNGVLLRYKGEGGDVVIPPDVKKIGEKAFYNHKLVTSVVIPSSVLTIEKYAFSGCQGISEVEFHEGLKSIGEGAFSYCGLLEVKIPSSVIEIGLWSFDGCVGLSSLTIAEGVKYIRNLAFRNCDLDSFTIPKSVIGIGDSAFLHCNGNVPKRILVTLPFRYSQSLGSLFGISRANIKFKFIK